MPDTENPQFSLKETKFYSVYLFIYAFNYSEKYNIWDWVTTFYINLVIIFIIDLF